jgi:hypothetical protein
MIKHTRQEWADFTGLYIADNMYGGVYMYITAPKINTDHKCWESKTLMRELDGCLCLEYSIHTGIEITPFVVNEKHDWKQLITPKEL